VRARNIRTRLQRKEEGFGWWAFILPENMKLKFLRSWYRDCVDAETTKKKHPAILQMCLLRWLAKSQTEEKQRDYSIQSVQQPLCQNMTPDP